MTPRNPSRFRAVVLRGLTAAGATLLLLGVGEAAARLFGANLPSIVPEYSPLFETFVEDLGRPFFRLDADGFLVPNRRVDVERGTRFLPAKPAGALRIMCVGESTVANGQFTRFLDAFVRELSPGRPVEVVNAGQGFIDPKNVLKIFNEITAYSPDAIVVYMGHNYAHAVPDLGPRAFRLLRLADRSRLARAAISPFGTGRREDRSRRAEEFSRVLEEMSRAARARDVPLIVCVPAGNLMIPPREEASRWRDPEAVRLYGRAMLARERGDLRGAAGHMRAFSTRLPESAAGPYALGLYRVLSGDAAGGRPLLERARDIDYNDRAPSSLLGEIRSRARAGGFLAADVEGEFFAAARGGVPGFDFFVDSCHPFSSQYRHAARAALRALGAAGVVDGGPGAAGWPAREEQIAAAVAPPESPAARARLLMNSGVLAAVKMFFDGQVFSEEAARYFEEALRADPAVAGVFWAETGDGPPPLRAMTSFPMGVSERTRARDAALLHFGAACRRVGLRADAARAFKLCLRPEAGADLRRAAAAQAALLDLLNGDRAAAAAHLDGADPADPYAAAVRFELEGH